VKYWLDLEGRGLPWHVLLRVGQDVEASQFLILRSQSNRVFVGYPKIHAAVQGFVQRAEHSSL
jgi:hypothetical protein